MKWSKQIKIMVGSFLLIGWSTTSLMVVSCSHQTKTKELHKSNININDRIFGKNQNGSLIKFEDYFATPKEEQLRNEAATKIFNKIYNYGNWVVDQKMLKDEIYNLPIANHLIQNYMIEKLKNEKDFRGYSLDNMSIVNIKNGPYIVLNKSFVEQYEINRFSKESQKILQNKNNFKYKGMILSELSSSQQKEFLINQFKKNNFNLSQKTLPNYIEFKLKELGLLNENDAMFYNKLSDPLENIIRITIDNKLLIRKYNLSNSISIHQELNQFLINNFNHLFIFINNHWERIPENMINEKTLKDWKDKLIKYQIFNNTFDYKISNESLKLDEKVNLKLQLFSTLESQKEWDKLNLKNKLSKISITHKAPENIDIIFQKFINNIDITYDEKSKNWIFKNIIWGLIDNKYQILNFQNLEFFETNLPKNIKLFKNYKLAFFNFPEQ